MDGKLIIFSAPSGSGKTTIVKHLLETLPDMAFSVSACTRAMRPGEVDGRDYYFIGPEKFKKYIDEGAFVEYEEVYPGNFYGTLKSEINRLWNARKHILFDIDVEGGLSIKKHFGDKALAVFVKPESVDEIARRLRSRNTENEEQLAIRIHKAESELQYESRFDRVLVNDNLEKACKEAELLVNEFIRK